MPYLSAEQHEIVNIEKVRRKHRILAITERFCSCPLYIHYPTKGYDQKLSFTNFHYVRKVYNSQRSKWKMLEVEIPKYGNVSMETKIQKKEEKLPIDV